MVVGSELVGQSFVSPEYFHPRPSAAGDGYDGAASSGSNFGPTNEEYLATVAERVAAYREENGLGSHELVPVDAVTASGSGLDPHISVRNAELQAQRVAAARGTELDSVLALIDEHTTDRPLGISRRSGRQRLGAEPGPRRVRMMSVADGRRGTLRIYLGAAPGVGKTFAMLNEGRRRHERGSDVVVGFVEFHGRARTADQVGDLEVVPRRRIEYRGSTFEEMDLDVILRRRPEQVLVDEYAHTNVPGAGNEKRWQDVDELLDAGIDVVSTVNIQHLESLNDVVEQITGVRQRETVPDRIVRRADQIELVDMAPEALRRRMAHGNVYAPEKVDAALANYFRVGNLSALRELALLWLADRVDDSLHEYRERHGITKPWETRERVVVAMSGAPAGRHLIRRAARIAERTKGELIGVHVIDGTGLASGAPEEGDDGITAQRRLLEDLGGEYRRVTSNDVAAALVEVARAENATQIVLGSSNRSRWEELVGGSVINKVVRLSGPIDVHVISERPDEPPVQRTTSTAPGASAAGAEARPHAAVAAPPDVGMGDRGSRPARHHGAVRQSARHLRAAECVAHLPHAGDGRRARRGRLPGGRRGRGRLRARQLLLHPAVPRVHDPRG